MQFYLNVYQNGDYIIGYREEPWDDLTNLHESNYYEDLKENLDTKRQKLYQEYWEVLRKYRTVYDLAKKGTRYKEDQRGECILSSPLFSFSSKALSIDDATANAKLTEREEATTLKRLEIDKHLRDLIESLRKKAKDLKEEFQTSINKTLDEIDL